jgi:RNA recognition motif-containing protein
MKITMKNMASVVTAAVLTLAFGMAYAGDDQVSFMSNNDTGTELYNAFLKNESSIGSGSAAGGVRAEGVNRSEEYTNDEMPKFPRETPQYSKHEEDVAKGSSAGGVRAKEASRADEYTSDTIPALNQQR